MRMPFLAAAVCGASVALVALAQDGNRAAERGAGGIRVVGASTKSPPSTDSALTQVATPEVAATPGASTPPSHAGTGDLAAPVMAPVGAIVAWAKSMPGTPVLPPGWVECNGQTVSAPGSPYHGQAVPNLNGEGGTKKRFLRGASMSGAVGGDERHNHGIYRSQKYGTQRLPVMGPNTVDHLPPFYDVVWIMRVK